MKKTYRNIGIGVAVFIAILLVLPLFINVNSFRPKIEEELSSALGRKAEIGDLSLSILSGSVSAANISIADDPAYSKEAFLTAKGLKIGVELLPLIFSKKLNITGITLDEPSITLLSAPDGKWNFSSIGGTAAETAPASSETSPSSLSIAELNVNNAKLVVGKVNSAATPLTIEDVNIEVKNFSSTTQFPFTLSAAMPGSGSMELEGKAGPIAPGGTPIQATLKIEKLDLAGLGVDPSVGLGGIGDVEAALDSDGKTAKANGTLSLDKLKLSPKGSPASRSVEMKFATSYDLTQRAGTISQGDVAIGKAVARLTGGYQMAGDATVLSMRLDAPGLPVDEVGALLPALGVTLPAGSGLKGGTLSATLGIAGPTSKLVIDGPVKLENSKLEGFDLGSKLSAISALSGKAAPSRDTTIQNASSNARLAPEGTRLDAINVTVPSLGALTGAGTVSPDGALNFNMAAELSRGNGVPFTIQGTTSDPKFMPDMKGIAGSAVKQAVGGKVNPEAESEAKGLGGLFRKKP